MNGYTFLKSGQKYITENNMDAIHIVSGFVLVYMVPLRNKKPGRRALMCKVESGHTIPGFTFKDGKHRNWRFMLVAQDNTQISVIPGGCTKPLQRHFAKLCDVVNFEKEGFEQGFVDRYEMILAKEDAFFLRTDFEKDAIEDRTDELIESVLKDDFDISNKSKKTDKTTKTSAGQLTWRDVVAFCIRNTNYCRIAVMVILVSVISIISICIPKYICITLDDFVPSGDLSSVHVWGGCIAAMFIGKLLFEVVNNLNICRLDSRLKEKIQKAVILRVFQLPKRFFRKFESADLGLRILNFGLIVSEAQSLVIASFIGLISSAIYFVAMVSFSPGLSVWGLLIVLIMTAINICLASKYSDYQIFSQQYDAEAASVLYQLIEGADKIHMAGVEDRAVYEYLYPLSQSCRAIIKKDNLRNKQSFVTVILNGVLIVGLGLFLTVGNISISTGSFIAFLATLGLTSSALTSLSASIVKLIKLKPEFERLEPILNEECETAEGKENIDELSGKIDMESVSFKYSEDEDFAVTDLSLHIAPGEYVGIVGASGSGKTTLLNLLLGFEKPSSGEILYDNRKLETLDLHALRRQFGVVLQDGQLIAGSILENLTIANAEASAEDIKKVLEIVSLKEDIDKMPMGLHTVLGEDASTISGGQKQRIMIARAILNNPSIMFFDEATSALDNLTQNRIIEALNSMHNTRVVIAHRLSTVRTCDKIYVMDQGRIVEEGDYDSLMQKQGVFREFAKRQLL